MSKAARAPAARRTLRTGGWRKSIFVADDEATAKAYATDPDGPYVGYYRSLYTKLKTNGRLDLFKTHRDQPDDEVTLESICDRLIIHGTPVQRRRQAARLRGRGRAFRHAALCGQGLEGSRSRTSFDDPDGREGAAPGRDWTGTARRRRMTAA